MTADQHLAAVLAARDAGRLRFARCASQEEVRAFEERHGVTLPEGYRRLITEVGNGGDGPPQYGLEPLSDRRVESSVRSDGGPAPLAETFPAVARWDLEDLPVDEADPVFRAYEGGRLLLGTDGCAILFVLVLTGSARGEVWRLDEFSAAPESPDVLSWYVAWLERGGVDEPDQPWRPEPVAVRPQRPARRRWLRRRLRG